MGQFKPGDRIRFHASSAAGRPDRRPGGAAARGRNRFADRRHQRGWPGAGRLSPPGRRQSARRIWADDARYRAAAAGASADAGGHRGAHLPGVVDLTPGIRSLQIHYDGTHADAPAPARAALAEIEATPAGGARRSRCRAASCICRCPGTIRDAELAMRKYQELVRPNAPWCPTNIEFIRRINGLPDERGGPRYRLRCQLLVLGLGDVYLGAPVATPIDPRHRLVTTKYNPARTWTPENAVGIGGAYMCIYGMEGPGGYQLFGRTIQVWNTWRATPVFARGKPWLLNFFDQIRFFPVSHRGADGGARRLPARRLSDPDRGDAILLCRLCEASCRRMPASSPLQGNAAGGLRRRAPALEGSRARQLRRRRRHGRQSGWAIFPTAASVLPAPCPAISGKCWSSRAPRLRPAIHVAIIESMKMEINVTAHAAGRVRDMRAGPGRNVKTGDIIVVLEEF